MPSFLIYESIYRKEKNMAFATLFGSDWWVLQGSNLRPSVRQTDALPAELSTQRLIILS